MIHRIQLLPGQTLRDFSRHPHYSHATTIVAFSVSHACKIANLQIFTNQTLDRDSQITAFAFFHVRVPVSDPFTDFMTGKLSERHARQDRRIFAMMYFGITALIVLAIVNLFI